MDLQTKTLRLFDIYPDLAREYAQKLHKKKEDIPFIQKFYSSEKSENVEAERAIVSYISTADIDRDNEILMPKGISTAHYEKSGKPVFWGHQYGEPKDVIGQCLWVKPDASGNSIVAKTAFRKNEFADEVYQLYTDDLAGQGPILRGWSVGFIPLEWDEGDTKAGGARRTYTKWELLEYSAVSIPCNPNAQTILGVKGIKLSDRLKADLGLDDTPVRVEEEKGDMPVRVEAVPPVVETPEVKITYRDADGNEVGPNGEVVTKPETTENYHRIPVSEGHDGHEIKTIDISEDEGIKALYCVPCKEVKTYLFDVDKWTMEEARAWVDEHKEGKAGKLEMTVTLLSDELQGELGFLRETIESMRAMLPVPSENDPESLKAFIGEVKEEVRAVGENVAELMATVEGMKAPAIAIEQTVTPPIEAVKAAIAPPPARKPEDIGAVVREVIAELDMGALLKQVVKVELAKLRGRVE